MCFPHFRISCPLECCHASYWYNTTVVLCSADGSVAHQILRLQHHLQRVHDELFRTIDSSDQLVRFDVVYENARCRGSDDEQGCREGYRHAIHAVPDSWLVIEQSIVISVSSDEDSSVMCSTYPTEMRRFFSASSSRAIISALPCPPPPTASIEAALP